MLTLKEATSEKHRLAERAAFNQRMFNSKLSKAEYLLYLMQQHHIFEAMEMNTLPHPALNRTEAVLADMKELTDNGIQASGVLASTKTYAEYLKSLSAKEALPHVYLNYLAVMFGGQMMKSRVPSSGKMYEFSDMPVALQAIRAVQKDEWAEEVNKGFDFNIAIFEALETACTQSASVAE